MKNDMKQRYRAFLRPWGIYYCEDLQTGKQETLKTRDKAEAYRLVAAKNETAAAPAFSLHLARVYWKAGDPAAASRTWQCVMDEILKLKSGNTHERWVTATKDKAFDSIRNLVVMETRPEHFLRALENGTVCTNIFLRRVQNFALDMSWLPWPVLPKKGWPKIQFKDKRGITRAEHEKILAGEQSIEWRAFYNLLWHLGGSQSDVANLHAEDVDWEMKVISFSRMKTGSVVQLHFGEMLGNILSDLPGEGLLLPRIAGMKESDRAKVYRFGRSIGQPDSQADGLATIFMPGFLYLAAFYLYCVLADRLDPSLLPPRGFKTDFLAGAVVMMVISFFVFGKRRKMILAKYSKLKNQRFYIWLGAIYSAVGVSLPVLMWFVFRAVMK